MPTLPPEWTAIPYRSPTATNTRLPSATPSPTATQPPTPTATNTPLPGERTIIGDSVAGRPLEMFKFGSGPVERLIVAGIHGGYEWNTIRLAEQLILHLNSHPEAVPPDVTLYILRALNPDGEARARGVDGQMNENGVDLNRNWPSSNWMADWPRSGCWVYRHVTGGQYPLSEPETRALADFILAHPIDALISYHSAALGIFAGGLPSSDPYSVSLAEAVAAVTTYPYPPIDTGCYYTGQFADWASQNGIAGIDVELTNHRDTDFQMNLRVLEVFLNWRRT
jgi:predicted deacylase